MKIKRLPAAQCRLAPPATSGKEPASVLGLFHAACPDPSLADAIQIDQGRGSRVRIGRGGPPSPARRVYAIRAPSGDQTGDSSLLVGGAGYSSGTVFEV